MATATGLRTFDSALETTRGKPVKIRDHQEFLNSVAEGLMREHDPEDACRAVFTVLERRMPDGEVEDVKSTLTQAIRELWP